ncbi:unnamed protein product [Prunus armeniaca]|uniref:Uncharacterized protein n=1 Tax=Prunus armeniaca TaxID=36596 RepID=A0A6J5WLJ9_PRUAR|nr:unnamed protein product [Prunus armeniaca]
MSCFAIFLANKKVKGFLSSFRSHAIVQIPCTKNTRADSLARLIWALDTKLTQNIPIEYLAKKSIDMADCISMVVDEALTWMTSLWAFLTNDALPH